MFWVASIWKRYSLPDRRAGSPVHSSEGPRMAKLTGQISSHALHDVHAHSSSAVTRSNSESAATVISGSTPTGGDTVWPLGPVRAITSPTLSTISRGSSGLPVAWAGHTLV